MASHVPPSRMREGKVAEPIRTRPAEAQRPRCLGAAAQLAAIHRTLRGAPVQRSAAPGEAAEARTPERTGLPDRLKAGVEAISGLVMDDVRVHRDSSEPAKLSALAFTKGSDIHLGPGQEQHLPHEAWHVVQQKQGRVKVTTQLKGAPINESALLEAEADRMGGRAAAGPASAQAEFASSAKPRSASAGFGGDVVQRRRVPSGAELIATLPLENPKDLDADLPIIAGVARMLSRAWGDLVYLDEQGKITHSAEGFVPQQAGLDRQNLVRKKMDPFLSWSKTDDLSQTNRSLRTDEADLYAQLDRPDKDWTVTPSNLSPQRNALRELADAIISANPALPPKDSKAPLPQSPSLLGNPSDYNRTASRKQDKEGLRVLYNQALSVFDTIGSGSRDAALISVFGAEGVDQAKTRYAAARKSLISIMTDHLAAHGDGNLRKSERPNDPPGMITDRSGYSKEVGKAGASDEDTIFIDSKLLENVTDPEAVLTLIHESLHAGNFGKVVDLGYINTPGFASMTQAEKLDNAAHFEIVPMVILKLANPYAGQTFTPVAPVAETTEEQVLRETSEIFRKARSAGGHLHAMYMSLFLHPEQWTPAHATGLSYWSELEGLTIKQRTEFRPLKEKKGKEEEKGKDEGSDTAFKPLGPRQIPAFRPITKVDLALSEGLLRRLWLGSQGVPKTPDDLRAFAECHAPAEYKAATGDVGRLRNLLLRLVVQVFCGDMTGSLARDVGVVRRLAEAASYGSNEEFLSAAGPLPSD